MKKIVLSLSLMMLLFSCGENETADLNSANEEVAFRGCSTHDVHLNKLIEDPKLADRMNEIESFTEKALKEGRLVNGIIEIPVVVNVLYKTAAENISLTQIQSQIDVLNADFNGTNSDFNNVPSIFSGVKANIGISFVLDAVVRKSTSKSSWRTDDSMKKSNRGGISPTSPTTKLNIWVCNMSGGILGYAQFPGGSSATDGVVIDNNAMGTNGTASAPFNLGRTATHEVGHWLNLRHIWGDATCGSDLVNDTPTHNTANYGCPTYPHFSTCSGAPVEMTMNYMDYTNDSCMYMFSDGQKSRMLSLFAAGGARNSFAQP